ncbi:MAG: penicillin-binding protein 1C [Polyangiaceae bacterium]|nr:penicillin-binding protein 1C [Polyangiaceae bacterium]
MSRSLAVLAFLLTAPICALAGLAARTPIPAELEGGPASADDRNSVTITDRTGTVLAELRDEDGMRQRSLSLDEIGEPAQKAILAAEDARFYDHPGIDPLAMGRALVTSALEGRVVSGASTLTQQLARTMLRAPRTVRAKVDVMALALRLEATYPKKRILEEYLNRVEFGPNVRGVEAASQLYFGKPARELSLAEAAALASIPRGPAVYDPLKHPDNLRARRDRVLERMADHRLATPDEVQRAKGEPIVAMSRARSGSAPHFIEALRAGSLDPCGEMAPIPAGAARVKTTLIADLQREIEQAARATIRELEAKSASAASIIVLDNASGDVLAYVGSPDASDEARLGANDGCRAKRQPGSTLKPLVYELAMEELQMTPATMLPDVELSFTTAEGDSFRPKNYDQQFHGPVLFRQALGNSFNVPAVWLTERLGPTTVLDRLHTAGFCSLTEPASHYGVALALGDGEVTLVELAVAYATLAREGLLVRPRATLAIELADGTTITTPPAKSRTVMDAEATTFITDVLKDRRARLASFGEATVFDLPFDVAAKTGTSKGFRDNWAVGYTHGFTVAVWVGNFDGSPMKDVSGITGAGPLFRRAMLATSRFVAPGSFEEVDAERVAICPLSGKRAGPSCPHKRTEILPRETKLASCDTHVAVRIDTTTGERAGPMCTADVEERVFEHFPPLIMPWARAAGRELPPATYSKRCPGPPGDANGELRVLYPEDGARFYLQQGQASHLRASATFPVGATSPSLVLDGVPLAMDADGTALLTLTAGHHVLVAKDTARQSEVVSFDVE